MGKFCLLFLCLPIKLFSSNFLCSLRSQSQTHNTLLPHTPTAASLIKVLSPELMLMNANKYILPIICNVYVNTTQLLDKTLSSFVGWNPILWCQFSCCRFVHILQSCFYRVIHTTVRLNIKKEIKIAQKSR